MWPSPPINGIYFRGVRKKKIDLLNIVPTSKRCDSVPSGTLAYEVLLHKVAAILSGLQAKTVEVV